MSSWRMVNKMFEKLRKQKKAPIKGVRMNNIVVVDADSSAALHPNQRVMIVKPTDVPIYSRITGERLGNAERVIGLGTVYARGDKVSVIINNPSRHPKAKVARQYKPVRTPNSTVRMLRRQPPSKEDKVIIQPILE